jgi:hypothetical protein
VALVAAGVSVAGLSSASSSALPRATEDRPDEVAGEQVHFLYVIPTDAPDEQLDVNGLLTSSIARMQAWLAGQTGGPKLRLDTYQGQPDITFVRSSLTPPSVFDGGGSVRRYIEQLGFTNPKKTYIAYLGAFPAFSCGLATRGANAAVVWLTCALEWPTTAPFSLIDFVAMHETLHALGAVPDGAPNAYPDGHVRDPRDIMDRNPHQPDENGQVTAQLDPGRDDYYGHTMRDETDVADSRYLDSNPISGTPKMRLGSVVAVKKVARGRLFVRARVSNPGTGRVTVQCSAKQGKRRLRVAAARYAGGTATCTFAGVRRGLVSGKVTVRSGQAVASRTFRVRPQTSRAGK